MSTKHEKILQYIESLPVGDKISVRQIAKEMQVSEGTAYRAIKEITEYLPTAEQIQQQIELAEEEYRMNIAKEQ